MCSSSPFSVTRTTLSVGSGWMFPMQRQSSYMSTAMLDREREREREREKGREKVCVWERERKGREKVCVCVCVREREREKGRGARATCVCVCVCVCVCQQKTKDRADGLREKSTCSLRRDVCICVCEREREREGGGWLNLEKKHLYSLSLDWQQLLGYSRKLSVTKKVSERRERGGGGGERGGGGEGAPATLPYLSSTLQSTVQFRTVEPTVPTCGASQDT